MFFFLLVLPWLLPKRFHDSLMLAVDVDQTTKVKTLRWLLSAVLNYQRIQQKSVHENDQGRWILQNIHSQNQHLFHQLAEIQRSLNALSAQSRLQQEEHFELERRLMELKFGRDPMGMSSDSVFENCSNLSIGDVSISMRNIDTAYYK